MNWPDPFSPRNCLYSAIFLGRTKVCSTLVIRTYYAARWTCRLDKTLHFLRKLIPDRRHTRAIYSSSPGSITLPRTWLLFPPNLLQTTDTPPWAHPTINCRTAGPTATSPPRLLKSTQTLTALVARTSPTHCRLKRTWPVRTSKSAFVLSSLGKDYSQVSAWQLPAPALHILLVCMAVLCFAYSYSSPRHIRNHWTHLGSSSACRAPKQTCFIRNCAKIIRSYRHKRKKEIANLPHQKFFGGIFKRSQAILKLKHIVQSSERQIGLNRGYEGCPLFARCPPDLRDWIGNVVQLYPQLKPSRREALLWIISWRSPIWGNLLGWWNFHILKRHPKKNRY